MQPTTTTHQTQQIKATKNKRIINKRIYVCATLKADACTRVYVCENVSITQFQMRDDTVYFGYIYIF